MRGSFEAGLQDLNYKGRESFTADLAWKVAKGRHDKDPISSTLVPMRVALRNIIFVQHTRDDYEPQSDND